MKRTLSAVIATAAILASGGSLSRPFVTRAAQAEMMYKGRPHKMVADRIIERDHWRCLRDPWSFETLPNGSLVVSRAKVCIPPRSK